MGNRCGDNRHSHAARQQEASGCHAREHCEPSLRACSTIRLPHRGLRRSPTLSSMRPRTSQGAGPAASRSPTARAMAGSSPSFQMPFANALHERLNLADSRQSATPANGLGKLLATRSRSNLTATHTSHLRDAIVSPHHYYASGRMCLSDERPALWALIATRIPLGASQWRRFAVGVDAPFSVVGLTEHYAFRSSRFTAHRQALEKNTTQRTRDAT